MGSANILFNPTAILLTGGAGFIGSHVVHHFVSEFPACKIVVLDKLDYCAALANLDGAIGTPNVTWCRGDIRSKSLVDHLLVSYSIDTIMNFAASTHVDNSFQSSLEFTANNVVGTHVLLESAREYDRIKRFIHVSTDEVYGGETESEHEGAMLAPTNPYACTKAAAELICRGYLKTFNLPVIISRGNNVYGPCQFPDKLVAKTCTLLARNLPAYIHGDGSHMRNYVYVSDMARAFGVILTKGEVGNIYNVGSDNEQSNLAVVQQCIRAFGIPQEHAHKYIKHVRDRELNDRRYHIDSTKLRELGWKELVHWHDGIMKTAQWYKDANNLSRWPHYQHGLTPHPSLDGSQEFAPRIGTGSMCM